MSSAPPPNPSATPPASSTTTPSPPSSPPPVPVAPPPSTPAPPPVSQPPPAANSPPPATTPPPPVPSSSPPPSASPPPPILSPPPSAAPPPPSVPSTPPATPNAPPPSSPSPPASRPPPSATPPAASSPPPPPPSAKPSKSPPSLPPRNNTSPPPSSPPGNSTGGTTPNIPRLSPPFLVTPPGSTLTPTRPSFNAPSAPGSGVGSGNRNPEGGGGGLKTGHVVAFGLVAALVVLGIAGLAVFFLRKPKKPITGYNAGFVTPSPFASSIMSDSSFPRSPSAPLVHHHKSESVGTMNSLPETAISSSTPWFSYEELYDITNGFSPQNILGEGGFGSVYKGCLPDGREVAVKRLKVGSGQGDREFKAEVEIISRIHHRHLVSLVGYCISDNQRMLVYDYVPNGTLESHLHGKGRPVMDWATRLKVAAGAAHGIAYLHEDCHPRIIHRDIKSSNILLDNNFEAQVSDFGLARLALDACTHVTTRVMGTFGYLAPEYASSGKLTEKSDVFSFGVVLLELITGRKPVDSTRPPGDESLVEWARPLLSHALETGELGELPDSRLENNYNKSEMIRMIEAAAACTRHSAAMRPQMGKVVRVLDSLADIDLSNGVTPGQSEVFNVAHSADIRIFQQLAFGGHDSSSDYGQYYWSHQSDM